MKAILLTVVACLLCSCASTNRTKTLIAMGVGGLAGATVGAMTAPKDENSAAHAVLWGGVTTVGAAVLGLFIFDEQKRSEKLMHENENIQKTLDALNGVGLSADPKLLYETTAPFGKDIPREYQHLVKPGRWSVYGLNQWVVQGERGLIHQDKMMKILPPEFNPSTVQGDKNDE